MIMKKFILNSTLMLLGIIATAQVNKTVVVEHFTNSRCGICAGKNPGLYQNLANHPDVIHIAFHPSSPYAACVFSQHNPSENDGRTNFYGIYGGTPWLVINGEVQPASVSYSNQALFDPYIGQVSPFSVYIKENRFDENIVMVEVTIKALSAHSQNQGSLFLGYVEDTVFLATPNGENVHPGVFREAMTGVNGDLINLPVAGDSVTMTYSVSKDGVWDMARMYTLAILQDPSSKMLLQAGETDLIEYSDPNFIVDLSKSNEDLFLYPNPVSGSGITIKDAEEDVSLYSYDGRLVQRYPYLKGQSLTVDVSDLNEGIYVIRSGKKVQRLVVVK
jgi:hypothetical protein